MAKTPGYVVEVDGIAELVKKFGISVVEDEIIIKKATDNAASIVARDQRKLMKRQFKLLQKDRTQALMHSTYYNVGAKPSEVGIRGEGAGGPAYYGWWEFGGDNKSPRGASYREYRSTGRTLYPALGMNQDRIRVIMEAAAKKMTRKYR